MKTSRFNSLSLLTIALFALLIFGGYTIIKDHPSLDLEQNAEAWDEIAYPMFTSDTDMEVKAIFNLCGNKKFSKALNAIRNLDSKHLNDPRLQFTEGVCLLQLENFESAQEKFEDILHNQYPLMENQAMWYLAVTKIKLNKIDQAQKYLEILAGQPNAEFHVQALDLLKELGLNPEAELL